jgi:hypothetical protein
MSNAGKTRRRCSKWIFLNQTVLFSSKADLEIFERLLDKHLKKESIENLPSSLASLDSTPRREKAIQTTQPAHFFFEIPRSSFPHLSDRKKDFIMDFMMLFKIEDPEDHKEILQQLGEAALWFPGRRFKFYEPSSPEKNLYGPLK